MPKIPAKDLYTACEKMLRDKWGYIWGTSGEIWTEAKQKAATREMTVKYGSRWIGHHVADCSGVMVYIWRQHGLSIYHGSNTIRRKYCGALVKEPHPGYAAFKVKGEDYHHIGIVAADGLTVYEAKGTQTGFVTSEANSWDCFAPFNDVEYDSATEEQGGEQVIWTAKVETESGRLNVRSGPGTEYPRIGSLPKGEEVDVFAEQDGWAFIAGDGLQGYVSTKYLKKIDGAPEAPPEDDKTITPSEPQQNAILWGVYMPCDTEEEARRYAGDIKKAFVVQYDKPPDGKGE